jgi:hypothetical protein
MKKAIIALLVIVLMGTGIYVAVMLNRPETRACRHVTALCGAVGNGADACVHDLEDLRQTLAPNQFRRATDCLEQANSCPEAGGCLVGMTLRSLSGSIDGFLKGISRAIGQPPR